MPEPQDLLNQARALGEALAAHPTVQAYYRAQQAVRSDASARRLLQDYQAQLDRLHTLEAEQKPIEVADKHRLRDLETQVAGHDALKTLMRTQADYVDLMSRVNRAIDEPLARFATPEKPA